MGRADAARPTLGIVGGGIAGLGAAHALRDRFDITILEREARVGGHIHPIAVTGADGRRHTIDTAFIGIQPRSYPSVQQLFDELGVRTEPIPVDITMWDRDRGLRYRFADFLSLCGDVFDRRAAVDVRRLMRTFEMIEGPDAFRGRPERLDDFLRDERYHPDLIEHLLLPAAAAVWGAQRSQARAMSARAALASLQRFVYRPADGGYVRPTPSSAAYLDALMAQMPRVRVLVDTTVHAVVEHERGVRIVTARDAHEFDYAVVAAPATEALRLLPRPSIVQRRALSDLRYDRTIAVVHGDARLLPPGRPPTMFTVTAVGGAGEEPLWVTTWDMTQVHELPDAGPLFVSLGDERLLSSDLIEPGAIRDVLRYSHIALTPAFAEAQAHLPALNQGERLFFAGSYIGWTGSHECAYASALDVSARLRQRVHARPVT